MRTAAERRRAVAAMKALTPSQWAELWRETKGELPSGARWWLRVATRADAHAGRAFEIAGRGWFSGPATERGCERELVALVNRFARRVSRRKETQA